MSTKTRTTPSAKPRLSIIRESPGYWRAVFTNPPINMWDPTLFAELNILMDDIENDKDLKVIVFESGDADFFVNHHDVEHPEVPDIPGAKSFETWPSFIARLAQTSVVSIAKVRGRARAQGFEFALSCDMRFASKERALFSLVEVAGAVIPGGGGIEWLAALVGRSRTLEIVLGADDFDAETAEKYGFVNRTLPDSELDLYVDKFAKRIAGFEKRALEVGKKMVNARAGIPSEADLWMSHHILRGSDTWPESMALGQKLLAAGMSRLGDFELNLAKTMAAIKLK